MKIKKLIISALLGLSTFQVVSTANADINNSNNWMQISEVANGFNVTCYWRRALVSSNGESGGYEYYNYTVSKFVGCYASRNKLPK
ncbi:hypothetical protein B9T24_13820 [Acinetobacter sp. ANC 4654]|uniref:hypothetical protein n=1 Tax=Acinetobacter sp. ANC 4654 TaxID=1977872 RepID=UPI000A32E60B|nr:hypothetical protein [Acinetobacter sp. ANC 4654]OTG93551.1 hypothetical protein B9T24_13820 [Acinetobacter sp. ANC 4654]